MRRCAAWLLLAMPEIPVATVLLQNEAGHVTIAMSIVLRGAVAVLTRLASLILEPSVGTLRLGVQ